MICITKEYSPLSSDKFEGPWFTTQLLLSFTIGITSFLMFSYCRTRWPLVFAPRTKLKGMSPRCASTRLKELAGFSPHEAHAHQAFFGWILPTIRISEFTVLQIVGLDAAVVSIPLSCAASNSSDTNTSCSVSSRCPFIYFLCARFLQL
jgi:hypothetical protein